MPLLLLLLARLAGPAVAGAPGVTWTADRLATDLIKLLEHRRWIAVAEVALYDRLDRRADVLAMLRSGRQTRLMVFELKVSRGDLLADLRAEKWRAYLRAAPVTFVLPKGLADPREIPAQAGLLVRGQDSWRWVRQAQGWATAEPPPETMRRLVMAVADQTAARAHRAQPRAASLWAAADRARSEHARLVLKVAADLEYYETKREALHLQVRELEAERAQLSSALVDLSWQLRRAKREVAA